MRIEAFITLLLLVSPVLADISANSTSSPRYVDTSVIDQNFSYRIDIVNESINKTTIFAPASLNITGISDVTLNGITCLPNLCQERSSNSSQIIVNFSGVVNSTFNTPVIIYFTANTSASTNISNFTATVHSVTNNATVVPINSALNVQPMVVANVSLSCSTCKATAILNGSDFWEFEFTVGLTAAQSGRLFFKMTDWIDANAQRINLNTSSVNYATFRNEGSNLTTWNNATNITTSYFNWLNKTGTATEKYYLRMLIPSGSPLSNSWSTSYSFLYRSTP